MANNEREVFARNLRNAIENSPMSQTQIADKLGISKGTMCDYLHCRAFPRPDRMAKLCNILGISQYDLTTDFHQEVQGFVPNRELIALSQELLNDTDARNLYSDIRQLEAAEREAIRAVISKLIQK